MAHHFSARLRSLRVPKLIVKSAALVAVVLGAGALSSRSAVYSDVEEFALDYYGFDPASYSAAGREGLEQIRSGTMFDIALPLEGLYLQKAIASNKRDQLGFDPTTDAGKFYNDGALPSPDQEADSPVDLGLSTFEREGSEYASLNCFACHAGVVNGVVVAGLASNSVIQRPTELTDVRGNVVRGDNYGQYAVWNLAASLADPAKTGLLTSDEETPLKELMRNTTRPPVQAMPWWTMKYKERDYWYGDGNPYDAAHFSLNFSIGNERVNERHAKHVADTAKALAFARETHSPIFPETLDAELVKTGEAIFHGRLLPEDTSTYAACFQCHGEYSRNPSVTDFSVPGSWTVNYSGSQMLRNVGTDPSYSEVIRDFEPIIEHLAKLAPYYEAQGTPELTPVDRPLTGIGYVPPPLVGVWTTAPYFHNGSVPTIEAVLNSALRPEVWARDPSPHAYDLENVGLEYSRLTVLEYEELERKAEQSAEVSRERVDLTFIYNTTQFGRGKQGHTWGDSMNDGERKAVIEFLKSLSGPDMPPAAQTQHAAR